MSMYALVHGENPFATILLGMLGLTRETVPRYRDAFWTGAEIGIYTRTGGGNRKEYERARRADHHDGPMNDDLRLVPTYLRDEDDSFDCTYATFYFGVPEACLDMVADLVATDATPEQRWQGFNEKLKRLGTLDDAAIAADPQLARVVKGLAPVMEQISKLAGDK